MSDDVTILSRADFLAATKLKRELVPVPELGGSVYVQELYAAQVLDFNELVTSLKRKGKKDISPSTSLELMARLVSMTACDATGKPLFTESDVKALAKSQPEVLIALSAKVMELSGLANGAVEEVKSQLKKAESAASPST
jgi:hypothetical protein